MKFDNRHLTDEEERSYDRARRQPLSAEKVAPSLWEVSNLKSESEHMVEPEDGSCTCEHFMFRCSKLDLWCKHIIFVRLILNDTLCEECGYETCRPACPNKEDRDERHGVKRLADFEPDTDKCTEVQSETEGDTDE